MSVAGVRVVEFGTNEQFETRACCGVDTVDRKTGRCWPAQS